MQKSPEAVNTGLNLSPLRFYTYYFTFHDLFAPLCLMSLSIYISLKFTGVTAEMKWKRQIYIAISLGIVLFSMVLAIPATVQAGVFQARRIRRREKLALAQN